MTTTQPDVDTARAQDLDEAHVAWSQTPFAAGRDTFGAYAIDFLRERGLTVAVDGDHPEAVSLLTSPAIICGWRGFAGDGQDYGCIRLKGHAGRHGFADGSGEQDSEPAPPTGMQLANLLALLDGRNPFLEQAVAMSVEEVADLLAALAERDLRWTPGEDDECGTLVKGPAEPPDLHVVFDCYRAAWQRDDDRAGDEGDPHLRWFALNLRRTWADLQRTTGPLSPDGGIAPHHTAPRDEP